MAFKDKLQSIKDRVQSNQIDQAQARKERARIEARQQARRQRRQVALETEREKARKEVELGVEDKPGVLRTLQRGIASVGDKLDVDGDGEPVLEEIATDDADRDAMAEPDPALEAQVDDLALGVAENEEDIDRLEQQFETLDGGEGLGDPTPFDGGGVGGDDGGEDESIFTTDPLFGDGGEE